MLFNVIIDTLSKIKLNTFALKLSFKKSLFGFKPKIC